MSTPKSNAKTAIEDGLQESLCYTEIWSGKPAKLPLKLKRIRLDARYAPLKKTGVREAFKTEISVGVGSGDGGNNDARERLQDVENFILRAYEHSLIDGESGGITITPTVDVRNAAGGTSGDKKGFNFWNDSWRLPPGTVITVKHTFSPPNEKPTELIYKLEYDSPRFAEWIVTVTPELWRIYDEKSNGPKLRIEIKSERDAIGARLHRGDSFSMKFAAPASDDDIASSNLLDRITREWGVPQLGGKVLSAINESLSKSPRTRNENSVVYEFECKIVLDAAEQQQFRNLRSLRPNEPLRLPFELQVSEAHPVRLMVEIVPFVHSYTGFLSIDFGNSGSSIVLFEPGYAGSERARPLPGEQLASLRDSSKDKHSLKDWLCRTVSPKETEATGLTDAIWKSDVLVPLAKSLGLSETDPKPAIESYFIQCKNKNQDGDKPFFELLKRLELTLSFLKEAKLRRYCRTEMYKFYDNAFRRFPFKANDMVCMTFDQKGEFSTPSDLELKSVYPIADGMMGEESKEGFKNWRRAQQQDSDAKKGANANESVAKQGASLTGLTVNRWFEYCPKRCLRAIDKIGDAELADKFGLPYFSQKDPTGLSLLDREFKKRIYPRTVAQAAWHALLNRVEEQRSTLKLGAGPFENAVVTYPAVLLPGPRKEIKTIFNELGVLYADTIFDEAVSPALFYFQQRYGLSNEFGPEAFKVRSTYDRDAKLGDCWYHNMLIVDIGAGTTDVAIVQIGMREVFSLQRPEFGGRTYTIEPKLLGSAGQNFMGGNQITLGIFKWLKILLAKTLSDNANVNKDKGTVEPWDLKDRSSEAMIEHLNRANACLKTDYEVVEKTANPAAKRAEKVDRFYALWDWAETIKISYSTKGTGTHYYLDEHWDRFRDKILAGTNFGTSADLIGVVFDAGIFKDIAKTILEKSVTLADGLAKESLKKRRSARRKEGKNDINLMIDSVALSGRACRMSIVEELFRDSFFKSEDQHAASDSPFSERTEIHFVSEFAKAATASGACLGKQTLRDAIRGNDEMKGMEGLLCSGLCKQDLNINNLLFYLSSSFGPPERNLFEMQTQFKQFGLKNVGCIRSDSGSSSDFTKDDSAPKRSNDVFYPASEVINVQRKIDGVSGKIPTWAQLDLERVSGDIRGNLYGTGAPFKPNEKGAGVGVQFEIDHNLNVYALLVRQTAFFSDDNSDNTPYDDTQKNSGVQFYPYYRLKAKGTPKSHYCELEDRDPKVYELWKQNFYRHDDKQTDLLCRADSLNHSIYLGNPDLSDCQLIIEQGTRFDEIGIEVQDDEDVNPQMTEGNSSDGRKHQNDQTEQKLAAIKDAAMLAERDTLKSMQKTVGCCWTEKPLELPANVRNTGGLLEFYTKLDNGQTILLAQLNPKIPVQEIENRDEAFAFEAEYRLLLTQDGDCHIFIGDVPPYWEANDPQKWVWPGQVYRKNINRPEDDDDSDLDPFNGRQ